MAYGDMAKLLEDMAALKGKVTRLQNKVKAQDARIKALETATNNHQLAQPIRQPIQAIGRRIE